ncbi:hypothetical protein NP493_1358g02009 [Ridgeia piscesae]|uniref:EGF-like domain-containing protein n=1 Tax=Ridgeia piscesae TaxID=27915 RepID=A0AAD9K6T9_RIDPI|nr:hypothetical protein NP493_1358g02009 [Ridgeia piscesae]
MRVAHFAENGYVYVAAICEPKCENNAICYDKNKCFCRSLFSGAACNIAKCSFSMNCFPGTCHSGDDRCICVSGFTGPNCNTMDASPKFNKCNIKLLVKSDDQEKVVFAGQCDPKKTYFSNGRGVTVTAMDWETEYEPAADFPQRPPYIGHYGMGVVSTGGHFTLRNAENKIIYTENIACPSPVRSSNPHLVSECRDIRHKLKSVVAHHYQIEVTMTASTGGYKKVLNTETHKLTEQTYTGQSSSQMIRVVIDLLPPTHCATTDTCAIGDRPPVDVGLETDNSRMSKRFVGCGVWHDADSGLSTFSYKVFPLAPDSEGQLVEKSAPIAEGKPTSSCLEFTSYAPVDAGMYSVVLTVEDAAGNAALARGLFLWDAQSRVTTTSTPMSVTGVSAVRDNVVWLTSPVDSFVVNWSGHFENAFQHDNKLLNKVKPWPESKGLDDLYGDRTVDAIPNARGIVRFDVGSEYINSSVLTTMSDNGLKESLEFQAAIADGDSIRVLIRAVDVTGNNATDWLFIRVDSSPPIFMSHTFEKNVDSGDPKLSYSSRVSMNAYDKESGITAIEYTVADVTEGMQLWNVTVEGHLETKNTTSCREDGTCACTPFDECFLYKHDFYINHCRILNRVGHEFQVKASIINMAGLTTPVDVNLGALERLSGVQVYPKVSQLGVSKIYGSRALLEWDYAVSCYDVKWVTFRYKAASGVEREVRLLASSKSYVMENLTPVTNYVVHVVIMYEGDQSSEATSLRFNSGGIGE